MNAIDLTNRLIAILMTASARGGHPLTRDEAEAALNDMIASDTSPWWDTVKTAKDELRAVVGLLRRTNA